MLNLFLTKQTYILPMTKSIFSSISINKMSIWDTSKSYVIACLYCQKLTQNTYMREKNTIR